MNCFAELVIAENKTAGLADASLRPDIALLQVPGEQPFRAVLASPMRTDGEPFGAVAIYSRQKQEWTTVQFRLAEWLAAQCAHILETLRLQEHLRESEERYQRLANMAPIPLCFVNKNGELSYFNDRFIQVFGYTHDDVPTLKEWWQLAYPEEKYRRWVVETWESAVRRAAETKTDIEPIEYHVTCKDGTVRVVVISGITIEDNFLATFIDVTERKRAEEALRQTAEDLARSNKDLEQFAYVSSHDLKEPLRMVTGFMSLLKERCQGKLDAEADQYISFAAEAALRMQGLIDDLLAYSRAGRGKVNEPTDVGAVLDRVMQSLTISIQESGAALTHDPLPTITSNAVELTQVFQNLIGNALKFKGERKPEIHIGAQRQARQWLFTIRDNGIGIDPQFAERIFMIFQRLHTREQFPGTGIGLAICKKIVERHGGRIWMESQPGKGSTFCFTLPGNEKEKD